LFGSDHLKKCATSCAVVRKKLRTRLEGLIHLAFSVVEVFLGRVTAQEVAHQGYERSSR